MKQYILFTLFLLFPFFAFPSNGDMFSAKIKEGIDMKFKVISEANKTCQVGSGNSYEPAISTIYTGTVTIPESVNGYSVIGIGKYAFYPGCKLTTIIIPNSVKSIGESAFHDCDKLESASLSENIISIETNVFRNCSALKSINIPNSVSSIGNEAFYNCTALSSIYIPNSVSSIGQEAFSGCKGLNTIDIPESVISIGSGAFWCCENIKTVIIPSKVSSIGHSAFIGCTSLNLVTSKIVNPFAIDNNVFLLQNGKHATLQIPNGTKQLYLQYQGWTKYFNEIKETPAIYNLSISVSGNGYALYDGTTIRSKTSSFTVNEGTNATISFSADNGYRIKSVKVNSTNVTSSVSNNKYTVSNIQANTTVEVEFEAIPPSTYTLSIKATGSGSASYDGTTIRSKTSTFTVNEGTNATISFSADNGYRIKSVKVNSTNVTSSVSNNQYTVSNIQSNTTVEVEFEAIPPTTYTLSISSAGSGYASYDGNTIRSKTSTFTVNEGTNATISFNADNGYRIKSVKVNSTNVTSSVSNNQYTVSNIQKNTTVEVEFEAIPVTTYTLSISSTGNGYASYDGTTIRSKTSTFTVNEGTNATISFSPDNGYRIKSVKVNSTNVTSSVSNNQYTVSNIQSNTTVEVEFEAIPPTTYTLSISSTGSGYASYDGNTIRSKTTTFTVNKGTNATISFSADNGYRIKSVKVNNSNVTSSVSNNQYTVSNIQRNITVEVEFEAIPPTTHTLSVSSTGSGYASYDGTTIRSKTITFTVNEGTNATISFSADNGYRIKSVKVNSSNVTSSVSNNKYTVSNIQRNTTVEVEFEAIPVTTYTLSIKATGNGSASYDGNTIRSKTSSFTVNEGTSAMITFNPDNGYRVKSVKVNSSDVTSNLSNNKYTISNINKNTTVEVEFQEELKTFTSDGLNYAVLSYDDKTVNLANGKYGTVLEVPATITYQDITWKVAGIDNAALANNEELAAIIWNPSAAFTVSVSNPNLLLYVKSASYAPATIQNVVVNSTAESIVLTDAASGNNFYCPKEFTAKKISYTHNYGMITGLGESRGWETIALPFDVKRIAHSSKGELTPFANWKSGDSKKPFWLMSYGTGGWTNASSIKANTPYIISMPNNPDYKAEFRLSGNITFSAENVTVKKSDNLQTGSYDGNTFTPNYSNTDNSGYLALNVNNDYVSYSGGSAEGSTFVVNLRPVHPFEAYMTSTSKTRSTISINGDMATGIEDITQVLIDENKGLRIYNLKGQLIKVEQDKSLEEVRRSLPAGVYIVNGKKLIIK